MFNSLKYAKKLEDVGFSRDQAEMHVLILSEIMETNLATKQDIKDLHQKMDGVQNDLSLKMEKIQLEIKLSEQRATIKLGTIVSIALGLVVALIKLIN